MLPCASATLCQRHPATRRVHDILSTAPYTARMWWWTITAEAVEPGVPGQVTLFVGVPTDAGGVEDVAVDGAAGQCAVGPSRLTCPATGPVTFRWGPSDERVVVGDAVLRPGEAGVAWLLTPVEAATLDRWRADATGADAPYDRREAVFALREWSWDAGGGPLPPTAPVPLPPGFLLEVADDPQWIVRRAVVELARDLRDPDSRFDGEVVQVLVDLARDPDRRVARASYAAISGAAQTDRVAPQIAWWQAMEGAADPGPRGRAATVTLARLAPLLEPDDAIDPVAAIELALAHHPEQAWRVWAAWVDRVPFREAWARQLVLHTENLNKKLLTDWSERDAAVLTTIIREWEPAEPHSERFRVIGEWLSTAEDPDLRAALGLPASGT